MENYSSSPSGAMAIAGLIGAMLIPLIIIMAVMIISQWKIFTKAGKPGWAVLVPIYNLIVLLEIVGKPTWWLILFLIPCVNIIFLIWTTNLLSKSFGQNEGFTVGLLLLGVIFYPILAFGNYQYVGPAGLGAAVKPVDPSQNYKDPFNNPPQA